MFKRSHSQIFLAFLMVHLVLTSVAGYAAWYLIDAKMRQQAESSAQSVANIITAGGFALNDDVLKKMQELSGYEFSIRPSEDGRAKEGTVLVSLQDGSARQVAINYHNQRYQEHVSIIIWATVAFVVGGLVIFIPVAWFIARRFARPLETLAAHAKSIGAGEWDKSIQVTDSTEIEGLSKALDDMRMQLSKLDASNRQAERLATLGTFTATIAHEVRNPLAAVKIMLQLVQKEGADARVETALEELERLDLMVDELLGFSAGMQVQCANCSLQSVAEDVRRLMQRQAQHADVALVVRGEDAFVHADDRRLRQMLINLVLNAIQALHENGGEVEIEILSDGVAVWDSGPGVPEQLIPNLFNAFSSEKERGSGLGLHLAKHIAEAHDASLLYQRIDGKTCFRLSGLAGSS